jgi:hypothetical protein
MYCHRHDANEGLAVWAMGAASQAEWELHFTHLREVATWSRRLGKRAACMLLSLKDFDRPDARTRQELAKLTELPGYDPFVAFVSPNTAVRATLTMFKWVQKTPQYEMDFFATSGEAIQWLARKRGGGRLLTLELLVREVDQERGAGLSSSARA